MTIKKNASKKNASKKCESIKFPKGTTHEVVLAKIAPVWKDKNRKPDGSLNPNNYAPIYIMVGDEPMSVRRKGSELLLSAVVARGPCPLPKQVW